MDLCPLKLFQESTIKLFSEDPWIKLDPEHMNYNHSSPAARNSGRTNQIHFPWQIEKAVWASPLDCEPKVREKASAFPLFSCKGAHFHGTGFVFHILWVALGTEFNRHLSACRAWGSQINVLVYAVGNHLKINTISKKCPGKYSTRQQQAENHIYNWIQIMALSHTTHVMISELFNFFESHLPLLSCGNVKITLKVIARLIERIKSYPCPKLEVFSLSPCLFQYQKHIRLTASKNFLSWIKRMERDVSKNRVRITVRHIGCAFSIIPFLQWSWNLIPWHAV